MIWICVIFLYDVATLVGRRRRREHDVKGNRRRGVGCRLKKEGEQGGEKGTEEKIKGDAV